MQHPFAQYVGDFFEKSIECPHFLLIILSEVEKFKKKTKQKLLRHFTSKSPASNGVIKRFSPSLSWQCVGI